MMNPYIFAQVISLCLLGATLTQADTLPQTLLLNPQTPGGAVIVQPTPFAPLPPSHFQGFGVTTSSPNFRQPSSIVPSPAVAPDPRMNPTPGIPAMPGSPIPPFQAP